MRCVRLLQAGIIFFSAELLSKRNSSFQTRWSAGLCQPKLKNFKKFSAFVRCAEGEQYLKVRHKFCHSSRRFIIRTRLLPQDLHECRVASFTCLRLVYCETFILYLPLAACISWSFDSSVAIWLISLAHVSTSFNIWSVAVLPCHTIMHGIRLSSVKLARTLPSMVIIL